MKIKKIINNQDYLVISLISFENRTLNLGFFACPYIESDAFVLNATVG